MSACKKSPVSYGCIREYTFVSVSILESILNSFVGSSYANPSVFLGAAFMNDLAQVLIYLFTGLVSVLNFTSAPTYDGECTSQP